MPAEIITAPEALGAIPGRPGFAAVEAHPFYGGFGRLYYPAVTAGIEQAASFAVAREGVAVLYVPAAIGDGLLAYNGMALRFFYAAEADAAARAAATEAAFRHIDTLGAADTVKRVWVREDTVEGTLGPIGQACLGRGASASLRLNAWVDLTADEAAQRRALRKSFRSLINWGRANMVMTYVNRDNPDRAGFTALQDFHRQVAGRTTRSQASWDAMYAWVAQGAGELALARLADGTLVAANLVVDGTSVAYYASGVYDRARFDKPLAHWPLWNAMNRARARGLARFDLGDVPLPGAAEPKETTIGYFKRGFAMSLSTAIEWRWSSTPARTDAA